MKFYIVTCFWTCKDLGPNVLKPQLAHNLAHFKLKSYVLSMNYFNLNL